MSHSRERTLVIFGFTAMLLAVIVAAPGFTRGAGDEREAAARAGVAARSAIQSLARGDVVACCGTTDSSLGGTTPDGIPRYTTHAFTAQERDLLRRAFGITTPELIYRSDSTLAGVLKVDMKRKRCRTCYVDSYRIGFVSMRRPGESWEQFEARIRAMPSRDFPSDARHVDTSLDDLDPQARVVFSALLVAARRAGFRVRVGGTYRTPSREALLFHEGHGRTYTATSMHSYGRAVDFVIDDGNWRSHRTRADWVRFRRFVLAWPERPFRLLGTVSHTWDWGHVELPASWLGFHSVAEALAFAVRCTSDSARAHPPDEALLGGATPDPCVFAPHLAAPVVASASASASASAIAGAR